MLCETRGRVDSAATKKKLAGVPCAVKQLLRPPEASTRLLGTEGLTCFLVSLGFPQAAGVVLGHERHLSAVEGASFASLRFLGQAAFLLPRATAAQSLKLTIG